VDTAQWAAIKKGIKPGDFLLVQFGHNDETHTCPRFVSTADYATYLGFMADTAKTLGATPIFVTPMGHRSFSGAKFNNTLLPYANSMKAQAKAQNLELIDLNLRSGDYYEQVGNAYLTSNIFDGGTTHFIKAGAIQMAKLVAAEIKKNDQRLARYLK
jgi:lysophospholipase L1-like esterase